jgi:hypothetical protein
MTTDGFSIQWDEKPTSAWLIHYLAIGGPDVTNAYIGTDKPTACVAPCSQSFSGVGFQPEFLMFLSIDDDTEDAWVDGYADPDTNGPGARVSVGFAGDSGGTITQGAVIATAQARSGQNNAITTAWQMLDRAILEKDCRGSGKEFEGQVTSFEADGFTLEKLVNDSGTETNFHYLALKGGRYNVGAITKPAATSSQAYTGVGFQPHGMAFFSRSIDSSVSPATDQSGRISFSAADAGYDPTNTPPFFPPTGVDPVFWTKTGRS